MRRCPICQWAVEQDHAEALGLNSPPSPATVRPDPPALDEFEEAGGVAVVDFALV
jgi:hypothetical protein